MRETKHKDLSEPIPRRLDADALDEGLALYRLLREIRPEADAVALACTISRSFRWNLEEAAYLLLHLHLHVVDDGVAGLRGYGCGDDEQAASLAYSRV